MNTNICVYTPGYFHVTITLEVLFPSWLSIYFCLKIKLLLYVGQIALCKWRACYSYCLTSDKLQVNMQHKMTVSTTNKTEESSLYLMVDRGRS